MSLPLSELLSLLGVFLAAGVVAGLIAGLFGVGGGVVIVPALFYAFTALGVGGEADLHVAVGTSLTVIVATSLRSLNAHRKHGAVDEAVLKSWSPWIALGAAAGALVAGVVSRQGLAIVYVVAVLLVAANMGFGSEDRPLRRELPTGWWRGGIGTALGLLSALMGVGGGGLGGMLMTLCGRPIHQAVATASGFGLAIGVPAALGFVIVGWASEGRPPLSLGYVNLPAALVMGGVTAVVAPWGARLAHRLDRKTLRRAFAAFLALTALSVAGKALG